ncbi:hypothetical protein KO02_02755 [Sphingobacterium sp. ML3W]|uniref:LamG-like jellyroll fold domain-containing protein n=1 Tax=Sphingobacterium sp. ML3W TaxID=1538644 RepID=UPI0004F6948C|nr:LamG-like jellyroll fold domain-containing protein [Sphingobacterium sp. ML3W]AIM35716.1 hypothetical protein KO02_02755 [Sphingobacterium sp. ML3W]
MKKNLNIFRQLILAFGVLLLVISCTKYENPEAVYEEYEQASKDGMVRKVLFISIDGVVGEEMRKVMPTNVAEMLKNSKYSFRTLSDAQTTDASTWMSMMSGVKYAMHQVGDESYIPKPNPNHPHENTAGYSSILYRISTLAPTLKSYVVARDESITNKLLVSADESFVSKTDEEVKNTTVDFLDKKNPAVTVVQFKDVLLAGQLEGFSAGKTAYADAIKKVDGYVGEIMTAVKNRKNYENEDWLVILTSNHGGLGKSYGGDSFNERNVFAVYYNQNFKSLELNADLMNSLRYKGWFSNKNLTQGKVTINTGEEGTRAVSPDGDVSKMLDIGNNPDGFTIEFKAKFQKTTSHPGADYFDTFSLWYHSILGKKQENDDVSAGWMLRTQGDSQIGVRLSDGTTNGQVLVGNRRNDEWFHFAATVKKIDSKTVRVEGYVNGVLATSENISVNYEKVISNSPFFVGYITPFRYGLLDFQLSDLRLWNKTLSAAEVSKVSCLMDFETSDPLKAHVVGYYRSMESNKEMKNSLGLGPVLMVSGAKPETDLVQNFSPCTVGDDSIVQIQSDDIYTQIFYWLELRTQKEWNLQGQLFLNKYEVEFLKP